ncbi:MAG: phosphoribosylanthranilate isomerase [Bdellovibrionales bacterium]
MTDVKICGLSDPENLNAAITAGARYLGFVFYEPSPRNVSFDTAWNLARAVPTGVRSVGLFVDPDDHMLERILTGIQLDMVQLHGNETPGRINEIKERYAMPVMKAIRIHDENDLEDLDGFEAAADWLLFDAKPPKADLPGGTGETFDWNILKNKTFKKPWMLSGGLDINNVQDALDILKPNAVDISSGVEKERGIKDANKIKEFIKKAKKSND